MLLHPFLLLTLGLLVNADQTIYAAGANALASGWENWSWGSTIDFASAGPSGVKSITIVSDAYAALSVFDETPFRNNYAGLKFDISGTQLDLSVALGSTGSNANSPSFALSTLSKSVTASNFTTVVINFKNLPGTGAVLDTDAWDRITFQAGGNGATYHITNIVLVDQIVVTAEFLSAEPLAGNLITVTSQGTVDFSQVSATLNNANVSLQKVATYSPPDTPAQTITYFRLSQALAPGSLVIRAGSSTFSHNILEAKSGSISTQNTTPISDLIYGINFPSNADQLRTLGIAMCRWGGNAVTAYDPFTHFTNAGNDWYFENRVAEPPDVDEWVGWVHGANSKTLVTIPALDWVAKDSSSYSYPRSVYPNQAAFDPGRSDAGNGLLPNGSWVSPPSPENVYKPWNMSLAAQWLQGMRNRPDVVTVDNEIEIASNTHQDMHPEQISFDEELSRVLATAKMAKSVLPNVEVAAPSTNGWWFYWTSTIGYSDNAAHGNIDFLPWFLQQMKSESDKAGKRLLDYLDIHYYFAPDVSANDAAAKALRLRMSKSLYDPNYKDESWIGTSVPAQWQEPNPNVVQLIPRMKQLINQYFPGTKLSISEWDSTADNDITGGLLTADVLGIFGREGVDAATYWGTSDPQGPIGLAYWLFRGNGTVFGNKSVQVNMNGRDEDVLGVYAGTSNSNKLTLVIVNKDVVPVNVALSNVPAGTYFLRHFGGAAGLAKWQTTTTLAAGSGLILPAYTAMFLEQQ